MSVKPILISTLKDPPGYTVQETFGVCYNIFDISKYSLDDILITDGKSNAIINYRLIVKDKYIIFTGENVKILKKVHLKIL